MRTISGSTGGVNVEALVKLDRPAARAMKLQERIPTTDKEGYRNRRTMFCRDSATYREIALRVHMTALERRITFSKHRLRRHSQPHHGGRLRDGAIESCKDGQRHWRHCLELILDTWAAQSLALFLCTRSLQRMCTKCTDAHAQKARCMNLFSNSTNASLDAMQVILPKNP